MNALETIVNKPRNEQTRLDRAIVLLWSQGYEGLANDSANELADIRDELQARLTAAEALVTKWRKESNAEDDYIPMPTDRAIGYETCADELAAALGQVAK